MGHHPGLQRVESRITHVPYEPSLWHQCAVGLIIKGIILSTFFGALVSANGSTNTALFGSFDCTAASPLKSLLTFDYARAVRKRPP